MIPDVLIGLNAGMSTYETWQPVWLTSRALSIPFAVMDSKLEVKESRTA